MTENDRLDGSDDPLEKYRQALIRGQSPETAPAVEPQDLLESDQARTAISDGLPNAASPGDELSNQATEHSASDDLQDFTDLCEALPSEEAPLAASDDRPVAAIPGEDLPSGSEERLDRYQMVLDSISERQEEVANPLTAPPEAHDGSPPAQERAEERSDDPLAKYRQAVDRQKSAAQPSGRTPAEHVTARAEPRETSDRFRWGRNKQPEAPSRRKATARLRQDRRPDLGSPLDWRVRAVVFTLLVLISPPTQWLVHTRLGAAVAPLDLVAGLSAVLPAALILFSARPSSFLGRLVTVVGSLTVAAIGGAGFAFGLTLLQNELPDGASPVLSLGVFTIVWGPLFLILTPVLSRMNNPAQGRT
jgi:hypothetical protein